MATSNRDVEFGAKVPADLYSEFKHLYPQYGAVTWFINAALAAFIQTTRDRDDLQERVHDGIESMLKES